MYYVYILKSMKNMRMYTGFTKSDPEKRLNEHNSGSSSYTRNNRPFTLIYSESFTEEEKARNRERFLKTGQGRKFIDNIIHTR